jgi:hypothetical protein
MSKAAASLWGWKGITCHQQQALQSNQRHWDEEQAQEARNASGCVAKKSQVIGASDVISSIQTIGTGIYWQIDFQLTMENQTLDLYHHRCHASIAAPAGGLSCWPDPRRQPCHPPLL